MNQSGAGQPQNPLQRVILTGGNGFIGSHLVRALVAKGVEVHAIANANHQRLGKLLPETQIHVMLQSPYAAAQLVTALQPDAIFHLAGVYEEPLTIKCVAHMVDGNLSLGTALLFGAAQCIKPALFINTGTYWQFDSAGNFCPNTVYAATKQAFQDLLFFYERRGFVSALTLVLYDTFGVDDTRSKLWAHLLTQKPDAVVPLTSGKQWIELVIIDDIVRAFLAAAELLRAGSPVEPVYCVRATRRRTLRDMVEELNRRADLRLDLRWDTKDYWTGQIFDPWQGPQLPGWTPEIDALDALVEAARMRRSRPPSATLDTGQEVQA